MRVPKPNGKRKRKLPRNAKQAIKQQIRSLKRTLLILQRINKLKRELQRRGVNIT